MKRTRINLNVLRASTLYKEHTSQPQLNSLLTSPQSLSLSRRSLLKMGGVAAMASVAMARTSAAFVIGPFEVHGDGKRLAFRYAGEERWVIDTKMYAGTPTLDIIRDEKRLILKLTGARYPGTEVCADFVCEIQSQLRSWKMRHSINALGFEATANFEQWLIGAAALRSSAQLNTLLCQPDAEHALRLNGKGVMRFQPDNSLHIEGKSIALFQSLHNSEVHIPSDSCSLFVEDYASSENSLLKDPYSKRCRISLQRGEYDWAVNINAQPATHWNILHDADMFDRVQIECAESRQANTQYAALFESSSAESLAGVQPLQASEKFADFILPLRSPRFAIAFNSNGERSRSFVARFGQQGVWLHQQGLSIELQDSEQSPHFELHAKGDAISRVICQPAMVKAMPHIGDAIVTPIAIEEPTQLAFGGFGAVLMQLPGGFKASKDAVKIGSGKSKYSSTPFTTEDLVEVRKSDKYGHQLAKVGKDFIDIKVNVGLPSLSIIRPHDLLVLRFYYENFQISSGAGRAMLSPTNATKQGYIVVEFQPQNVFEQAFYETDPNLTSTDSTSDSSQPESGDEFPTQPPVKARIAGPSRLAFKIPKGASIPLTLDDLLNWDNWDPSLVPVAQQKDKADSSSLWLYPGMITYFSKQGIKFNPGAFIDKGGGGGAKSISVEDFEASMTKESVNKFKSSGIEYSSKYNTGYGIARSKTTAASKTGASKRASSKFNSFSYSDIATKVGLAGGFAALVKPKIQKPEDTQTAIELPYRLFLSPLPDGGWTHSRVEKSRMLNIKTPDGSGGEKVESLNFTELWHTRLWFRSKKADGTYYVNERDGNYLLGKVPKVRAIWSPDYISPDAPPPTLFPDWRGSLTNADRWSIVMNSSNFYAKVGEKDYQPKAIDSNKLFLSAIGGWVDVHGAWDPVPSIVDLVDWIHRGTMGRDHYVRVMYRGYLFPFGHKCTLVKVTERKFNKPNKRGTYGAYLRQRMFIIVRQPDIALDDTNTLFKYQGREIPFKNVHIKTVVTPNISQPNNSDITGNGPYLSYGFPAAFEIKVPNGVGGSTHFMFQCTATDWDGNKHDFTMPLAFVLGSYSNTNATEAVKIINNWYKNRPTSYLMRKREFKGARIAFGPSKNLGDTTFETDNLVFSADYPRKADGTTPNLPTDATWFYPTLHTATIRHQDVEQMSGSNVKPDVSFHSKFLEEGFDEAKNVGEVLMQFASQLPMSFGGAGGGSSDKSGGFISPNQVLSGLSRAIGPISGAAGDIGGAMDKFTGNSFNFDPSTFLSGIDAKIFGVISLMDIIQMITGSDPRTTLLPRLLSKAIPNLGTDPAALLNKLQNEVYNKLQSAYDTAYAEASGAASSILAKLQEMKELLDGLKDQLEALSDAISSASGTGDIFTILTDQLPEFLTWITTNLGPLGIIPADALATIQEVSKFLESMQDGIRIGFDWKPKMQADPIGFFIPADPNDTFVLSAYAKIPLSNKDHSLEIGEPEAKIEGYLQNFTINLIPVVMDIIAIPIIKLGFSADLGKKSDIFCELGTLQFKGPLKFVNELQKYIPLEGFIDPPAIDVDASGIKISFDLAIPNIAIGLFSLTNISLGAALQLPFLGDSMLFKFEFCKKDVPFHMTYSLLGGGGYFGLTLSLEGVDKIEAAFEIGAELSVDFGVASGGISIFAGVYFSMEGDVLTLTGYVKIHGEVDVLGIISASITLEMSITYVSTGKLYGVATLTIEIEVFIFSGSVEITVEKYFKGSAGDPTIAQLMPDSLYPESDKKYFELYAGAYA